MVMSGTGCCDGPQGFRPILRGLVLVDGGRRADQGSSPSSPGPWPGAFLAVAERCAAGQDIGPEVWHGALAGGVAATAQEQSLIELVVATPLLLINRNPHGHRRSVIQAWGQAVGLSAAAQAALDDYFRRLGGSGCIHGMYWRPPHRGSHGREDSLRNWDRLSRTDSPTFAEVCHLVDSLPGQWSPALALAQRWNWPAAARALVGMLVVAEAGLGGLPGLGHREEDLGPCWQGYTVAQMDALADALYQRWAGHRSGLPTQRL